MEEEQQLGGVDGGSGSGAPPAQLLRETEPMRKEAELR